MTDLNGSQEQFEFFDLPTIKGFPELRWTGKRPYRSTLYYPAQRRERYGSEAEGGAHDGWINKLFWGDNLQVMSHLLAEHRGQVDLIYIDPPFDSKADYKKKISLRGQTVTNDASSFEEKQYGDIWTNDEYLQFMYERLILCRELLSDTGSIYLHCDYRKAAHLRLLLDEVFGQGNLRNEIIWSFVKGASSKSSFGRKHQSIFYYSKRAEAVYFNLDRVRVAYSEETLARAFRGEARYSKENAAELAEKGKNPGDVWADLRDEEGDVWEEVYPVQGNSTQNTMYPTQKPEKLLERIVLASSRPGDLVFDCFMGSGTTQAVAMKLGRRFIGADINLGSIQTTTKRLLGIAEGIDSSLPDLLASSEEPAQKFTGFEVYNVNNYDFFRNPVEARQLLIEALEVQPFPSSHVWDGELNGRMVKIMPVNRIATKADLEELKANLPYKSYEKRKDENPGKPVERITLVCMGHDADLKASLEAELSDYKVDVEVVDILRDRKDLHLKRDAEAEVVREGGKLVIRQFYPLNLMQKLSMQKEFVDDWRQLVESVMVDWNYDGVVIEPSITDVPGKGELVTGIYDIPDGAGTIKVKITDLLAESLEVEV